MNQLIVIDGVSVRNDHAGRYCLNDLHVVSGSEDRHKPSNFLRLESIIALRAEIDRCSDVSIESVVTIRGGANQGTYVCREIVYAYAMWISPVFNLKVIRTFDLISSGKHEVPVNDLMQAGVTLLGFMRKELNLSNSSVLGACQKLQQAIGLPNLAPEYAIDAPSDAVDGSSRPTMALSTVLKSRSIPIRTTVAFGRLAELGIVERRSRPSTSPKAKGGIKYFWSVTSKGLLYGKNLTSPGNPRETQPHFYESKVAELIKLMMTAKAA
ncbi:KilA-N domain-containing protein [Yersinia sp. 1252 StPb PI]|uniref:KilA-N domain-containing protein n=1 Tax=Yersinia sp. 1252 StPb PI TaxID=3117404 RepID=UPI003B288EAF